MTDNKLTHISPAATEDGPERRPRLARLLGLFERLDELGQELEENPARRQRDRLLAQKRRLRLDLFQLIERSRPISLQPLLSLSRSELSPTELALLGRLFFQRLRAEEAFLTGRELLWFLTDSTYELFELLPALAPGGALMASGLVQSFAEDETDPEDILNRIYSLAPEAYRRLTRPEAEQAASERALRPFADGVEHFLELVAVLRIAELRAASVFDDCYWHELHGEVSESLSQLDQRLEQAWRGVEARLMTSRDADRFPLRRLQNEFQLGDIDLIMVVALAAQEALKGLPSLAVIDLLRLVSRSPRDLLRRRGLLGPRAVLIREGLVLIEEGTDRSSLTGEVALAPWVLDRLVGGPISGDTRIGSDEKIDFHDFLSRLDGSDDFFEQL